MPDLLLRHRGRAADALAAGAGLGESLVRALDDQFPDELGERGEHMEDQPSAGRGGVERLVQGLEADAALAQAGHDRDEVLDRATEPVEGGHDEGVAGPGVVEGLPQLLALGVLAGLLVGEDPGAPGLGERADLAVEVLALRGDASVADPGPGRVRGERLEDVVAVLCPLGSRRHVITVHKRVSVSC